MEWLSPENVVAVLTAVLGVLTSAGVLWYERRVPRRKRIGYRVQMDTPIGSGISHGRANLRVGLFDDTPGMADATLVLLRIENDGSQSIADDDYTRRGDLPGLTAEFTGRTVRGIAVTHSPGAGHLMDHFTPADAVQYSGSLIRLPRVPLNRNEHFKLLVLLTGSDVGGPISVSGGIRDGVIVRNTAARPDEKPPLFGRASRIITVALTVCVVVLAGIIVVRDGTPPPMGCARGTLTVTGSTAFRPVVEELRKKYEEECEGSAIVVDTRGSNAGVRALEAEGSKPGAAGSPSLIALSDGPKPPGFRELHGRRVAVSLYSLVVNDTVPVRDLSLDEIRRIYGGGIRNWKEIEGGPDLEILLVSRDANSGTREVFQRRVLGGSELAASSRDCVTKDYPKAPVTRCELDGTDQVLSEVAALDGAIDYTEMRAGEVPAGTHQVSIDGISPSVGTIATSGYPYRETEYAYTYGSPPANSLAAGFLDYLDTYGEEVMRVNGHLPCATPEGMRLCGED
ncbi:substrate-binding domain-containing protein [Streptomyces sp. NBC_00178]|uniref:substrate-binding domain-containing protein n=1 Tax=Streptomyces sp. NBC_00178 TaxID=2975672 RepID=UPI002E29F7BE|nr:substrate-binding domain-containing protein [Streptomyces sp. NBC_00178]